MTSTCVIKTIFTRLLKYFDTFAIHQFSMKFFTHRVSRRKVENSAQYQYIYLLLCISRCRYVRALLQSLIFTKKKTVLTIWNDSPPGNKHFAEPMFGSVCDLNKFLLSPFFSLSPLPLFTSHAFNRKVSNRIEYRKILFFVHSDKLKQAKLPIIER